MIQLFRGASPYAFFILLLLTIGLRLPEMLSMTHFSLPDQLNYSWFRQNVLNLKTQFPTILSLTIEGFFLIIIGTVTNRFLVRFGMIERNQIMPNFLIVLFFSMFPVWTFVSEIHLSIFFSILSIRFTLDFFEEDSGRESIFFAGFFSSLSVIIFFPFIAVLIPIVYALFLRTYKPADWLLFVIGIFLPFYFIGIYYYYQSEVFRFSDQWKELLNIKIEMPLFNLNLIIGTVYLIIVGLYSFLVLQRIISDYRVLKLRRQFNFIVFLIPFIILSAFISGDSFFQTIQFLCFPVAILFAKVLLRDRPSRFEEYIVPITIIGIFLYRFKDYIHI